MTAGRRTGAPDAINLGAVSIGVSDYVSQGNAILGIRDSGKSYTATRIAEELLQREIPFVAFDPIGVWRFLRHGKRKWDVLVAGENADVELTAGNAVDIVRHAMTNRLPLVLDLYSMALSKADWRRIVESCVKLLLYENKAHGPRHIFIEEAAEFVPQMVTREYGSVYAEIEKLARMGGNAMLGYTLINQRAEQINKAVLELCDCLFLHRQKGRLSLTALSKWLDFGNKKESAGIIERLPMLNQGECFVWKGGEDTPVFTVIPPKQSFHPNRREHTEPGPASDVSHMLAGLELSKAPAKRNPLQEGIDRTNAVLSAMNPEPETVRVPVFGDGELVKLDLARRELSELLDKAAQVSARLEYAARATTEAIKRADAMLAPRHVPTPKARHEGRPTIAAKGPQRILSVLAARHPMRLTESQLGTLSAFTPSTMRTYLPGLRAAGMLDQNADGMGLTPTGLATAGKSVEKMPTGGRALLDFWKAKLPQGEATILESLYDAFGKSVTMEWLEKATSYTPSTLRTYLPTLRRNNLIDPTELRISPEFVS